MIGLHPIEDGSIPLFPTQNALIAYQVKQLVCNQKSGVRFLVRAQTIYSRGETDIIFGYEPKVGGSIPPESTV